MKEIGIVLLLYSNDNRGAYPPDLGTVLLTQDVTIDSFFCPNSDAARPDHRSMTPQQLAAWVNANGDYVYIPGAEQCRRSQCGHSL